MHLHLGSTTHDELRSGQHPWRGLSADLRQGPLTGGFRCEVLVVGAGITGALVAEHLARGGRSVALVDREPPGLGSTAASTAMLQWEIDAPLAELAGHIGLEEAAAIYRQSLKAVAGLGRLVAALDIPCAFRPRSTLYLAAREVGYGELVEEHRLRRRAGLPGQLLDAGQLRRGFDLDAPGAILSPGSAECDPLCLAQGLVALARAGGVRVLDGEATAFGHERGRPMVEFAGGQAVEADHVVLATGYALPACIHSPLHKVVASWAVKTLPQAPEALWRDGALIWEASEAYAYLRTTGDGGIIIGGEDQIVADAQERDRLLAAKAERLCERLHELRPRAHAEIGARWTGFFGETKDGLPLIGPVPGLPGFFGAYGYGGNGITFSFLASRLITGMIEGERPGWARSLRIDRGTELTIKAPAWNEAPSFALIAGSSLSSFGTAMSAR